MNYAADALLRILRVSLKSALKDLPSESVQFPHEPEQAHLFNLRIPLVPAVIISPRSAEEVAIAVKAAREVDLKVQAKSGGHNYANYNSGGVSGQMVIDLKHLQKFHMDHTTWRATIGAGTLLGDVTRRLHDNGGRAIPRGVCPQVGIGGHATMCGQGPTSRMWDYTIDAVKEVEVVTAAGDIVRASESQHPDLFWALLGAGGSFGVVTEFIFETQPEPAHTIEYRFQYKFGSMREMGDKFKKWQKFVSQPNLDRRPAPLVVLTECFMVISGTFYGPEKDFEALGFEAYFNEGDTHGRRVGKSTDWVEHMQSWTEKTLGEIGNLVDDALLKLVGGVPAAFYSRSLIIKENQPLPDEVIDKWFDYMAKTDSGTIAWAIIADLENDRPNTIPSDATAYPHRDSLWVMQSYAIDLSFNPFDLAKSTFNPKITHFLDGIMETITTSMPDCKFGSYAGYSDPVIDKTRYWLDNYPRLLEVKKKLDPDNRFANPQSVGLGNSSLSVDAK